MPKLLLAIVCGLISIAVFPKIHLSFLAWVCLIPLLIASYQESKSGRAFLLGFLSGIIFFFGVCYWIINVLKSYGGLSWVVALFSFLLLAAYLSLFYGIFSLAFSKLSLRFPTQCFTLSPFLWVASEYLRTHLLTGFPWCLLGYALVDYSNLAQLSTFTGIYGMSFVLVIVNSLATAVLLISAKAALRRLIIVCLILCGVSVFFFWRREIVPEGAQKARIVQTNIDLEQNWDTESKLALLDELSKLSLKDKNREEHSDPGAVRITLWPETPAPFYFNHDMVFRQRMKELAKASAGYLLFGFVDFSLSKNHQDERDPYNSVALLSPQGDLISQYDKIHLVPFGEYVPYTSIFFFVNKISTEAGNFRPGNHLVISCLDHDRKLGTFVCYEAIFPDLIRRFAKEGAQAFVNVTNDGWFGDSPAPYQHLNMARFRAIENHRYLLRAANNGISALIDPYGRLLKETGLNERCALELGFEFQRQLTFYARHGDLFSQVCLGITLLLLGYLAIRAKKRVGMSNAEFRMEKASY